MVWALPGRASVSTQALVDRILASGQMTRKEHLQLAATILSDQRLTQAERYHISRVFDELQEGRVTLVD
ncbi:MAG: hypothetical protein OHK0037_31480 [Elainellaceae cyanobacterium]|jgi:hypothetical protein